MALMPLRETDFACLEQYASELRNSTAEWHRNIGERLILGIRAMRLDSDSRVPADLEYACRQLIRGGPRDIARANDIKEVLDRML